MKRLLGILLLMIITVAVLTPCCTDDDCEADLVANQDESKKPEPQGSCSPFFACTTCPGFTSTVKQITIPDPAVLNLQHFESYPDYHLFTYTTSPWQPPRMV